MALNKVLGLLAFAKNITTDAKEALYKTDDARHALHVEDQHDQPLTDAQLTAQGLATESKLEAVRLLLVAVEANTAGGGDASEATLDALLTKLTEFDNAFDAEDFATQTTLAAIDAAITTLNANDFATEATLASLLAAISDLDANTDEIEAKLDALLTELLLQQKDGLTDAELRAAPVPVTGTVATTPSGIQDVNIVSEGVDLATETTLTALQVLLGSLDTKDYATETTLAAAKAVLDTISAAVADLDANTDEIETKLDALDTQLTTLNGKDFATETTLAAAKAVLDAISAAVADLDANTDEIESKLQSILTQLGSIFTELDQFHNTFGAVDFATSAKQLPDGHGVTDQHTSTGNLSTESKQDDIIAAIAAGGGVTPPRDNANSSNVPLADATDFTGDWVELKAQASIYLFTITDQPMSSLEVQWSNDGATQRTGFLGATSILSTEQEAGGFYIYLDVLTTDVDNYYRVFAENTSGSNQTLLNLDTWLYPSGYTGTYLGLNDALGTFDKALLARSVLAGVTPAGDFVNIPVGGIDPDNSTQDNLAAAGTFIGEYQLTSGYTSALIFALSDVPLAEVKLQWSADGVNPRPGLLSTSVLTEVNLGGFYIYLSTLTTMIDLYFRLEITNGDDPTNLFEADSWLYEDPFPGSYGALDADLSPISTALLTRAVQAGVQPDGSFVNRPEGGEAFRYATNKIDDDGLPTPDAALLADEEIVTPWIDTQGHTSIEIYATSDVESAPDGIRVEYASDQNILDENQFLTPDFYDFSGTNFATGKLSVVFRPKRSYSRFYYKNNPTTDQTRFEFVVNLDPGSQELPRTALDAILNVQSEAITVKGGLVAADDAKSILPIGRDGEGAAALNVHLKALQDGLEFVTKATTIMRSGQIALSDQVEQQVPIPPDMPNPKTLRITHPGGEGFPSVYFRSNAQTPVTQTNGDIMLPSTSVEVDVDGAEGGVQVILGTPDTPIASEQDDLIADTVDSNSGVTSPANMFADDGAYASFTSAGNVATISGFDATGEGVLATIDSVVLRGIARKEPGAPAATMAYSDPVTGSPSLISRGSQGGGTAIISPTLLANSTLTYFVVIARENTGATVTNVTNTMGFSGATLVLDVNNGGESRHSIIQMTGTPTGAGTISVFLSQASSHSCITVVAVTNFGSIQATNTFTDTSGGSFNTGNAAGTANGLAIGVVASELANTNTPVTNFTTREQGGSAANDDQTLWVGTRTTPTTTNYSLVGTTDGGTNDDITASIITIIPSVAADPVVEVTVTADGGDLATTMLMTLTAETDQAFELDITDLLAAWSIPILNAATVTAEATLVETADAQVEQLFLDVDSSSNALRMGYTWVGD